ncbi:GyrI-like domain-containing protein [Rapidithrix thailandica]|uniref:GyrI-like domain-containing protein n=1 Tax=Rapidithrix thailandica TaxID=413964 RepID=A0AAW9SFS0_9BACT
MSDFQLEEFAIVGIAVRTSNENGQAAQDIPALWDTFLSESIPDKIPNKVDNVVYSVYTEYEKDHTKPYTTVLGCKVTSLESVPEGMKGIVIKGGTYQKFIAKGKLSEGVVYEEWTNIWNTDLPRIYSTDFEVYGEKSQHPEEAEVDIWIAVN